MILKGLKFVCEARQGFFPFFKSVCSIHDFALQVFPLQSLFLLILCTGWTAVLPIEKFCI
jgi:hypothetical protein